MKSDAELVWVLPNRDQRDEEIALVDGSFGTLSDAVDFHTLPKAVVLGVPEELVRKHTTNSLIFGQFAWLPDGTGMLVISTVAGHDRSGRAVFLTAIMKVGKDSDISWPIILDPTGLPADDMAVASRLNQQLATKDDEWTNCIRRMRDAVHDNNRLSTFSSIRLERARFKPEWPKKKASVLTLACAALILTVILVVMLVNRP